MKVLHGREGGGVGGSSVCVWVCVVQGQSCGKRGERSVESKEQQAQHVRLELIKFACPTVCRGVCVLSVCVCVGGCVWCVCVCDLRQVRQFKT